MKVMKENSNVDEEAQTYSLMNQTLKEFYTQRGFSGRVGFGERPALLVIDLAKAWTTPYPAHPFGSDLSSVLEQTVRLLGAAREGGVPIFFTTMAFEEGARDAGANVARKLPSYASVVKGSEWVELHPALQVRPEEPVIVKQRGSAFFGTTILSQLVAAKVDTLLITGCSTSGCIRDTAVDAWELNYRVIVPREAVGDRSQVAHEANLFDIDWRMGDVVSVEEAMQYLERVNSGRLAAPV